MFNSKIIDFLLRLHPRQGKKEAEHVKLNHLVKSFAELQSGKGGGGIRGRVTFYEEISGASSHPRPAHVRLKEANL